jgi:ParB-like chromosome segregation protein Spo0J
MNIAEIKVQSPFKDLFAIDEQVLNAIAENIRFKGFDVSQPIVVWEGRNVVVDGHTRLAACRVAGIGNVPACVKQFADEKAALAYAIHNQRNRRNLTETELLRCIEAVDKRREAGRPSKELASSDANLAKGKSAKKTAEIVGTSQATVERARNVLSDPEAKQAVMAGEKSINRASQDVKAKRKFEESMALGSGCLPHYSDPKPRQRKREIYEPYSDAIACALIALSHLDQILDKDPKREEAIQMIEDWINKNKEGEDKVKP